MTLWSNVTLLHYKDVLSRRQGDRKAQAKSDSKQGRKRGLMTMQQGTCARRFGRPVSPRRGRRHAIALMAIALLVAVPFVARGQGTGQGTVQVNPAASGA